jgi:hypothetical protein
MHEVSETISLERPRKAIFALLYVVFCFACLLFGLVLANVAVFLISGDG